MENTNELQESRSAFHMAKPYFTHEVHFTNSERDLFH